MLLSKTLVIQPCQQKNYHRRGRVQKEVGINDLPVAVREVSQADLEE